jgi:hypothetical protein
MRECGKMWYSRTGFLRRIPNATNTHSEYVILIVFHLNDGYTNASQCYFIRTLPVFLCLKLFRWVLLFRAVSTYITGTFRAEFNIYFCRQSITSDSRHMEMYQAGIASDMLLSGLWEAKVLNHPILRSSLGYYHKNCGFVPEQLNCGAVFCVGLTQGDVLINPFIYLFNDVVSKSVVALNSVECWL